MLNLVDGTIVYVLIGGDTVMDEDTFFAIPFESLQVDYERHAFILQPKDEFKMHLGMAKIIGERKV